MQLITSMNEMLYHEYGKNMIKDFRKYSYGEIKLIVVVEGNPLNEHSDSKVRFIKFNHSDHERFIRYFGKLYEANGLKIIQKSKNNIELAWNYRFNAIRFSFKIFAVDQVVKELTPTTNFAWIDADIRCLKNFNEKDLEIFFPNADQIMSYLGRNSFPPGSPYSECGFLGFNGNYKKTYDFIQRMKDIYITGEIFSFEQWHDSWIWDIVRKEYENKGERFKNISGKAENLEHPFINCELGNFFDHLKGPTRKAKGKSDKADYIKNN